MIRLNVCPPGGDDWTEVQIAGEDEDAVAAMLQSRLGGMDWEVEEGEDDES